MKAKGINIAIIGLLIINLGTLVLLWTKPDRPGPHRDHPKEGPLMHQLRHEVGFDNDQLADFAELRDASHQERDQMERINGELRHQQLASIAQDSIIDNSQEIAANVAKLERMGVQFFSDVRNLCEANQLDSFDALLSHLGQRLGPPPSHPGGRPHH